MFAVNMGDEKRVFEVSRHVEGMSAAALQQTSSNGTHDVSLCVIVKAHAITKSHVGRGIEGLLPNDVELADRYTKANPTEQKRVSA